MQRSLVQSPIRQKKGVEEGEMVQGEGTKTGRGGEGRRKCLDTDPWEIRQSEDEGGECSVSLQAEECQGLLTAPEGGVQQGMSGEWGLPRDRVHCTVRRVG